MDILMCSYYYALCAKDDLHREHVFQSRTPHKPCWKKSATLTLSIFPFSGNVFASISCHVQKSQSTSSFNYFPKKNDNDSGEVSFSINLNQQMPRS